MGTVMAPALAQEMDAPLKPSGGLEVPLIDLQGSQGERRGEVIEQLRKACIEWGGFQIINHGVPVELIERMRRVTKEFFALPLEEKWKFSATTPTNTIDLFQGYGTKDFGTIGALDHGDQLRHKTLPLSVRAYEQWPTNPASFRETEEEYVAVLDKLNKHLLELISESLGLSPSFLNDLFGEYVQTILVNHYPPCLGPTPTVGFQQHSDFSAVAILMQDAAGLQLRKDGEWVSVEYIPGAFSVNLGGPIEILTNGLYKSPEHRAMLTSKERFSIVAFCNPPEDLLMALIPELLSGSQPRYRARTHAAYRTEFLKTPYMAKTLTTDA